MHKELEVMKPRCNGLWKRCTGTAAFVYFWILANVPAVAFAKDEKGNATDLVLGCVGGVGVIFLAWGLLDFGTGYSAHDTTQQSQAIKKVIGGLIMIAVPAILKLLGVS